MVLIKQLCVTIGVIAVLQIFGVGGKSFDRCEFAQTLVGLKPTIDYDELSKWVCIAEHESNLNSAALTIRNGSTAHGVFQLSDRDACSNERNKFANRTCNIYCDKLRDDNVADDFACAQQLFVEIQERTGAGFNAWTAYEAECKGESVKEFIKECHTENVLFADLTVKGASHIDNSTRYVIRTRKEVTTFNRCDLVKMFELEQDLPREYAATWACLVINEGNISKSSDGEATDDPLERTDIKLRDLYPCDSADIISPCFSTCSEVKRLSDVEYMKCMKKVYDKERASSGNGFNAWTAYKSVCRDNTSKYSQGCSENETHKRSVDEMASDSADEREGKTDRIEDKNGKNPNSKVATASNAPQSPGNHGKVYERCELARELHFVHNIPKDQIKTWLCIVENESNYSTAYVTAENGNGGREYGLFQISDNFWCSPPGSGTGCGIACDQLLDNDITDDIRCVKKIYDEQQKMTGVGFSAWGAYSFQCAKKTGYPRECFDEVMVVDEEQTTTIDPSTDANGNDIPTGKVYELCELARELRFVHHIPAEQINTFVCLAENESNFTTNARGEFNDDGSVDHGGYT